MSRSVTPHADLRCPHVGECAHPRGGLVSAAGECIDCGARVASPQPSDRLAGSPRMRRSGDDAARTLADYDGPAEFSGGWSW